MPTPVFPFQNFFNLGLSPEIFSPFWDQFQLSPFPNGAANGTMGQDIAVSYLLTSAQLLALQTTAVQILPPPQFAGLPSYLVPPGGFLYVPNVMTTQYKYGGTAYTIGNADNAIQLEYTGKSTSIMTQLVTGLVDQTASTVVTNSEPAAGSKIALTNCANLGVEAKLVGTTPALTLGNGVVYLNIVFSILAMF